MEREYARRASGKHDGRKHRKGEREDSRSRSQMSGGRTPSRSPSPKRHRESRRPPRRSEGSKSHSKSDPSDASRFTADVCEGLKSFFGEKLDEIRDVVGEQARRIDAHDQRLDEHEHLHKEAHNKFELVFERLQIVEAEVGKWKAEAAKLGARLVVAESAEPTSQADRSFNRIPNPAILTINAKKAVPVSVIQAKLDELLVKGGLSACMCKLRESRGKPAGKFFIVTFLGSVNLAGERVERTLSTVKDDEGKWESVFVDDNEEGQIQIYLGRDKSDRMRATEIATKKLPEILVELHGSKDFFPKKFDGEVHSDWRPLAKVDVVSKSECKLLWETSYADELGIERAKVADLFKARNSRASARPPPNWSCS